ncbi:hypothetical protein GTA08_BOTSDO05595 [Botryosphaeria dothidea]|uniref:Cyclin-dependent protein kinase regulator pho80 protein n=1 Tax=Botryosphaeria dothidea TaxID=55169 RepID=A0A8H4N5K0_9PEZI|nr:hypothetical protein GTA08_BOTSDO05595 [Botryosphaeria dothidea]
MPSIQSLLVVLTLLVTAAFADKTINVHAWPLGASAPQHLAQISYDPATANASVVSWKPPTFSTPDALVRVGLQKPDWTGILTSGAALGPDYKKTLVLHADAQGAVYSVGFGAEPQDETKETKKGDDVVEVRVEKARSGPAPVLNKPVVLDESGKIAGQGEPEKTFLQKYWWAIALFLVLQLFAGGKE